MRTKLPLLALGLLLTVSSCNSTKRLLGIKDKPEQEQRTERRSGVAAGTDRQGIPAEREHEVRENLPQSTYANKVERYIATYARIAQDEMRTYNIPASITLAQGILESGAGVGELTRTANNHFGIKCHGWKGGKVYHDDDRAQECFRKYKDAKYSFRDHSLFLAERPRYAGLFELPIDDYKGWARGLKAAGYATDPKYPVKLISIIERYGLDRYDAEVLGKDRLAYGENSAGGAKHVVRKGDTLYSIAKKYNTSVEELQKNNNLTGSNISIGQTLYVTSM